MVVATSPGLDDDLGLLQRVEDLAVQQLIPELPVERLDVAVLPGRARFDEEGLRTDAAEPVPQSRRDELRPIVAPHVVRHATLHHQTPEPVEDVFRAQSTRHVDAQALAGELIDHGEELQGSPVVGPVVDKVVAPDVVPPLGPEAHAGAVVQPQAAALGLFARDAQPFAAPDPLDALVVHGPPFSLQKRRNAPVAVAPELARQFDDSRLEPSRPFRGPQHMPLGRSSLSKDPACPPFGYAELGADTVDRPSPALRTQKFPSAASLRTALSR